MRRDAYLAQVSHPAAERATCREIEYIHAVILGPLLSRYRVSAFCARAMRSRMNDESEGKTGTGLSFQGPSVPVSLSLVPPVPSLPSYRALPRPPPWRIDGADKTCRRQIGLPCVEHVVAGSVRSLYRCVRRRARIDGEILDLVGWRCLAGVCHHRDTCSSRTSPHKYT